MDPGFAATRARAKGPLHARPVDRVWTALRAVGVPDSTLETYVRALAAVGVLIALTVPAAGSAVACAMLADHQVIGTTTTAANPTSVGTRL